MHLTEQALACGPACRIGNSEPAPSRHLIAASVRGDRVRSLKIVPSRTRDKLQQHKYDSHHD